MARKHALVLRGSKVNNLLVVALENPLVEELVLKRAVLRTLPDEIGKLDNLRVLRLQKVGLETLSGGIWELEGLEVLDLRRNLLHFLPPEIEGLQGLREIDLRGNPIHFLPPELFALPKLRRVRLDAASLVIPPKSLWRGGRRRRLRRIRKWYQGKVLCPHCMRQHDLSKLKDCYICGGKVVVEGEWLQEKVGMMWEARKAISVDLERLVELEKMKGETRKRGFLEVFRPRKRKIMEGYSGVIEDQMEALKQRLIQQEALLEKLDVLLYERHLRKGVEGKLGLLDNDMEVTLKLEALEAEIQLMQEDIGRENR